MARGSTGIAVVTAPRQGRSADPAQGSKPGIGVHRAEGWRGSRTFNPGSAEETFMSIAVKVEDSNAKNAKERKGRKGVLQNRPCGAPGLLSIQ